MEETVIVNTETPASAAADSTFAMRIPQLDDEEEVPLTVREFDILYKLLSYPKKTFTRAQLMDEFWGYETESDSRTVDVYITRLRNKFKACTAFEIVTVHGLGYKAVLHENGK